MSAVDDFNNYNPDAETGSNAPSFKFAEPGDKVAGTVESIVKRQRYEYGTDKPLYVSPQGLTTDKTDLEATEFVITLATGASDPGIVDDDGRRRIFVPMHSAMHEAIMAAVHASGSRFEVGSKLAVTYTGMGPSPKNPKFNRKNYTAAYKAGDPVDEFVPPAPVADDDLDAF